MGRTYIAAPDWMRTADFAGNAAVGFPLSNMKRIQPTERWQSIDLQQANLQFSLTQNPPSDEPMNLVSLLHHNASETGSWRTRAETVAASEVIDSSPFGTHYEWTARTASFGGYLSAAADTPVPWSIEMRVRPSIDREHGLYSALVAGPHVQIEEGGTVTMWTLTPQTLLGAWTTKAVVGEWLHLSITYDGASVRLYANGVLETTIPHAAWGALAGLVAMPSNHVASGASVFQGEMSDVRIWSEARDASQIFGWFQFPLETPYDATLHNYWSMPEGSGAKSQDVVAGVDWEFEYVLHAPVGYWRYNDTMRCRQGMRGWESYHSTLVSSGAYVNKVTVDMLDNANPDGFIRIGRLYVANAWHGISGGRRYGDQKGFRDMAHRQDLAGGQVVTVPHAVRQTQRFTLVLKDEAEMYNGPLGILRERAGMDVLIAHDLDDAPKTAQEKTLYGTVQARNASASLSGGGAHEYQVVGEGYI